MRSESKIKELKQIAGSLAEEPGVYQFFDKEQKLIYVGKAKNLKKRVMSYFGKNISGKTLVMRNKIATIKEIVVENESEALLLENSLIKKYQPRYNVLMKDDKTFPWIVVRKEVFPRVYMTRNVIRDGSVYFGPYTSVVMVKTLLGLIRQLYKLRTCNLNLSAEKIESSQYKVCLEYHIGNCSAPCVGKQTENDYNESISQIKEILGGNIHSVNRYLRELMKQYSSELKFEEAQVIKEKLEVLDKYRSRSTVVNPRINNADVFASVEGGGSVFVNYIKIIKGAVIQTQTLELKKRIDESLEELMSLAITELRQRNNSLSKEIIVPFMPDIREQGVKYTCPRKGDKLKLIDLALRNAVLHRAGTQRKKEDKKYEVRDKRNLEEIKNDLRLPELPVHIECFDNSNIQGHNPVASCVVFRGGRPSKKEYRHYNIKTVKGADDFASMSEVVLRRYSRLVEEGKSLPQLIIVDGGKGQLNAAVKSLEKLGLRGKISIAGIAKRLEEIYFPGDSVPLYIDKNSYSLKIIQQLRNEAHRFGINFHRAKRSKEMIISELDQIKGIGEKTKEVLLKEFGSVAEIREADQETLEKLAGASKAIKIMEFFRKSPQAE
ncbi:MAG: excinuclease ABC subunit UvrC [Marinilabiliaceae bacterium]|nr:excinuclease ABC subunit UvrC [Marinilabiliaceae bacterium]